MSATSFANELVHCPVCLPELVGKKKERPSGATLLYCVQRNYSGCSVDIARCPKCGRGFQVSYRVAEVAPAPNWDHVPKDANG